MTSPFRDREYRQAVELSRMKKLMAYTETDFREDMETAIAIAQLLSINETRETLWLLEDYMSRVIAYSALHPYALVESKNV
jgi:hypothetical protein